MIEPPLDDSMNATEEGPDKEATNPRIVKGGASPPAEGIPAGEDC